MYTVLVHTSQRKKRGLGHPTLPYPTPLQKKFLSLPPTHLPAFCLTTHSSLMETPTRTPGTLDAIFETLLPLCHDLAINAKLEPHAFATDLHMAVYNKAPTSPVAVGKWPQATTDTHLPEQKHDHYHMNGFTFVSGPGILERVCSLIENAIPAVLDLVDLWWERCSAGLLRAPLDDRVASLLRVMNGFDRLSSGLLHLGMAPPSFVVASLEALHVRWFCEVRPFAEIAVHGEVPPTSQKCSLLLGRCFDIASRLDTILRNDFGNRGDIRDEHHELPPCGVRSLSRLWPEMVTWIPLLVNGTNTTWSVLSDETKFENSRASCLGRTWRSIMATPALRASTRPAEVFQLACACLRLYGLNCIKDSFVFNLVYMALDVLDSVLKSAPELVVSFMNALLYDDTVFGTACGVIGHLGRASWGSCEGKAYFDTLWNVGLGVGLPPDHALHYRRCSFREGIRRAIRKTTLLSRESCKYLVVLAEVTGETAHGEFVDSIVSRAGAEWLASLQEVNVVRQAINARWSTNRRAWVSSVVRGVQERARVAAFADNVFSGRRRRGKGGAEGTGVKTTLWWP